MLPMTCVACAVVDSDVVYMGGLYNRIDSRGWCTTPEDACYLKVLSQKENAHCWYRRCNETARARIPALVSAVDADQGALCHLRVV